jgi:putative transposase
MSKGVRYTPETIIQHLRTAEIEAQRGVSIEDFCRKIAVSPQTFHRWKKEFGGLRVDQAKRLKDLEQENSRLKKIVADLSIDNSILKEVSRGNF